MPIDGPRRQIGAGSSAPGTTSSAGWWPAEQKRSVLASTS